MSACSIYIILVPRQRSITLLNLGSGWSHSSPRCVLLASLVLIACPRLRVLRDIDISSRDLKPSRPVKLVYRQTTPKKHQPRPGNHLDCSSHSRPTGPATHTGNPEGGFISDQGILALFALKP